MVLRATGKLGLWEGGKLQVHAVDWQFGQNAILDAAGLAPVNTLLLTPHTKLFGYVGFSDADNSPFHWTGFLSVEAFGPLTSRPNDRMGIGYFYNALNSDFQNAFRVVSPIGDLQGGEVYYNAAITPWFHLTADLQVVEPAIQAQDTALVLGLRAKIDF